LREPANRLGRAIGHQFVEQSHLEQALTHRSAGGVNNERQEFLGDAILGFIIADELYHHFPDASEGQLSRMRAGLVKKETLAGIARQLELGNYLSLGPGELRSGGQSRDSILADGLEALFAAVYLDSGYAAVRQVILGLFRERIATLSLESQAKDPKTRLQEYLQSRKLPLPSYTILEIAGEQHEQHFIVECRIEGSKLRSRGSGGSRRKAEQAAAGGFLQLLQNP